MDHFGSNDIQEPAIVSDTMFDEVVKVPGAIPNAVHRVNTTYREQVIQNQDGSLDTVKIKVKR